MKYLIRKTKDNKFIDMQTVSEEYIHEYQEIDELGEKQGFYISYEYDKEKDKIVGKYIEISKTYEELLLEEINKIKRTIAGENEPDLSELDNL